MRKTGLWFFAMILTAVLCSFGAMAQAEAPAPDGAAEPGLNEIEQIAELTEVQTTEGMSLEELTEAVVETAMADYFDSQTGFSMQYPAIFQFDETQSVPTARTGDGSAVMTIESLDGAGNLTAEMLTEAIRLEVPDANPQKNEQNGCLRLDRAGADGRECQTDLYLLTAKSFHHITVRYPAQEKERYDAYIEYMINSMAAAETDQG